MVDITTIQTFDHKVPRETEIFANFYRFFIKNLRSEVFSDTAIVYVTQLVFIVFMIKQVVNIDIVYIALDTCQVDSSVFNI